jgi:radical SAM protein with 4Fe4S-binding SPASM domain
LESKNRFFFTDKKDIDHLKSLYNKLAKFYTQEVIKGKLTYENTYFNRFFKQLSRLYHIQSIVGTCSAGYSLMAVDMDGSIYPCTAFVGIPRFKIGTVGTGISDTKLQNFLNTKIYSSEACSKCWAKRICRGCGSCYNLNYFTNKNLGQPDNYYCELFRYKTKLMIAMISEIGLSNPSALRRVLVPQYYVTRGRKKDNANQKNTLN